MPQPRNDLFYTDGDQTTTTIRGRLHDYERTIADRIGVITPREKVFLLFTVRQSRQIKERLAGVWRGVMG